MAQDTLLLDKSYQPLTTVSWQKAICLLIMGKAEVVSEYDTEVHSVSTTVRLPAVARLIHVLQPRCKQVKFSKQNILARDRWKCQYCGTTISRNTMTLDHVVPRAKGGRSSWENVVAACEPCNWAKADRSLLEARRELPIEAKRARVAGNVELAARLARAAPHMRLRKTPVRPSWVPVFAIKGKQSSMPEQWIDYLQYAGFRFA